MITYVKRGILKDRDVELCGRNRQAGLLGDDFGMHKGRLCIDCESALPLGCTIIYTVAFFLY
jgi:hypothetical protein